MTTHVDHLSLIAKTIETQYDLARIELFRPLEVYDRWNGIKAAEITAEGGDGRLEFVSCGPGTYTGDETLWDSLKRRLAPIRDALQIIALTHGVNPVPEVWQTVCFCSNGKRIIRYSVRVQIVWNNRTLMREYALPELPEEPVSYGALGGKQVGPGRGA